MSRAAIEQVSGRVTRDGSVGGEFMDFAGERYYGIRNVDQMLPFFVSVISSDDHWLFVSSTGGLTAGRVSPETALFPYVTVDKIHDSAQHSGSRTILRIHGDQGARYWEPFNHAQDGLYSVNRHLYKNLLGNKLCFEEINHDLGLAFRYTWCTSQEFGFVRECELENFGEIPLRLELLDGLQNILPAGTPIFTQTNSSNLVDAYKWSELDPATGLAYLTLYSGISDRAEPCESLKATTVFCLGLEDCKVLVSSEQLRDFQAGKPVHQESMKRGIRAAYLVNQSLELAAGNSQRWRMVANLEQSQSQVVALRHQLRSPADLDIALSRSIEAGSDGLARIMAGGDGFQVTGEENVSVHHYANVLFNILRGGVFDDHYNVSISDFSTTVAHFNQEVYQRNQSLLESLPEQIPFGELMAQVREHGDSQLQRLAGEYLPITFGRRHGDPSRPWNQFAIRLKDEFGNGLLSYQGNWRDIFQNWEALVYSYPGFIENVIAKFVNASTMDGYNPYRITKEGIDWEVEEPDNPWSYIGYWGDHQIIYLQKLLELSRQFHPDQLQGMLREPLFCYANVPYRIRPFQALLDNPKNTIDFDEDLADRIEQRVTRIGADGKLVLVDDQVLQVNLLEKLLVPLLSKLGNLVIDGGIWLNTQRPEWNDANNALVGHGLSMVTLYYMRRYVRFMGQLLAEESGSFDLSGEVNEWLERTASVLQAARPLLDGGSVDQQQRLRVLTDLGQAASDYRETVYRQGALSRPEACPADRIRAMLDDALAAIDYSIGNNHREDGLYEAYNLLHLTDDGVEIDTLYPMLEGQVAALSAGALSPETVLSVLEALFDSSVYRADQNSFMLYPDRELPGFLEKNQVSEAQIQAIPLLQKMVAAGDERIVLRDADGCYRFSADFANAGDLKTQLNWLGDVYGDEVEQARDPIHALYEEIFRHREFTGRSGTMFGFEGLGSIYWHMVSKLLLAVEENFFAALDSGADPGVIRRLGSMYYRVRQGIGFNKTPQEYGAFPTDPYSHTPRHAGARQPGMTGQVKEEVLARFGELGVRVAGGRARFQPALLRRREFTADSQQFCYLDVDDQWQDLTVPADGLAFTWCQVPVIYRLSEDGGSEITLRRHDGQEQVVQGLELSAADSSELFNRSGRIRGLSVTFGPELLLTE